MPDSFPFRLGKQARRHDERTLRLSRYLASAAQPLAAPPSVDYTGGVTDWGMMLNDQLGDCIIADGPGHATQVWTLNATGTMVTPPDSLILATYEKWCGYDPAKPASDQGGVELDVLNAWRQQGFGGQTLDAYAAIALGNGTGALPAVANGGMPEICTALWLFGGAYIGVELPLRAQRQDVWDVPAHLGLEDEPGSWGGHAVYLTGYGIRETGDGERDAGNGERETRGSRAGIRGSGSAAEGGRVSGVGSQAAGKEGVDAAARMTNREVRIADSEFRTSHPEFRTSHSELRAPSPAARTPHPVSRTPYLTCITWGTVKHMTWAWFEKYCSEAYALVSKEWLKASGVSPSGFDLAALEADLKIVAA